MDEAGGSAAGAAAAMGMIPGAGGAGAAVKHAGGWAPGVTAVAGMIPGATMAIGGSTRSYAAGAPAAGCRGGASCAHVSPGPAAAAGAAGSASCSPIAVGGSRRS